MASEAPVELGTLIISTPGVHGGRPCLAGTRIPVLTVAAHYRTGESAEQIAEHLPHAPLSHIHAAIAYYLANRERVDAELADEEALYERLAAESRDRRSGE
jgi:uncharacterized protein (DUF433 family)